MTISPDLMNGLFELFSGLFVLNHCRVIMKDKAVAGVSIISAMFFVVWGLWNLYYYPHLGQTFSLYAGIVLCLANTFWVSLLIKYSRRNK